MKLILLVFNQSLGGGLIKQYFDGFTERETHSSSQLHINHELTHRFGIGTRGGAPFVPGLNSKCCYVKASHPRVCELLHNEAVC